MNYSKPPANTPTTCGAPCRPVPQDLANVAVFLPGSAATAAAELQNVAERALVQLVAYRSRGPRNRDGFAILTLATIADSLAAVFTSPDAVSRNLRALTARGVLERKQFGARLTGYKIAAELQDNFPATQRGSHERVRYQCLTLADAEALNLRGRVGAQTLARYLFRTATAGQRIERTAEQLQTVLPGTLPTEHAARAAVRSLVSAGVVITCRGNRATRFQFTARGIELAAAYERQTEFEFEQIAASAEGSRLAKIQSDPAPDLRKSGTNTGPTCENPVPKERESTQEQQTTEDGRAGARSSSPPSCTVTAITGKTETMNDEKPTRRPPWPPEPSAVTMKRRGIWPAGWSEFIEAAGGMTLWRDKFCAVGRGTVRGYLREFPEIAENPEAWGAIARHYIEAGDFDRGPYGGKCNTVTLLENVMVFDDPVAGLRELKQAGKTIADKLDRGDGASILWAGLSQHYPKRTNLEAAQAVFWEWSQRTFPTAQVAAEILTATRERFRTCSTLHDAQFWPSLERWIADERWRQAINIDANRRAPERQREQFAQPWPGE